MARRTPIAFLMTLWDRLRRLPGGTWLFSVILGFAIPYTGSIAPRIEVLEAGRVRVRMRDRRAVRNHLQSVHALALANLGELASGLAVAAALPPGYRFIPMGLAIDYLKKARGTITAECTWLPGPGPCPEEAEIPVSLTDPAGTEVARVRVRVKIGPEPA